MAAPKSPTSPLPASLNIGFIGAGQMAEALVAGFIKSGLLKRERILMSHRGQDRLDLMKLKYGVRTANGDDEVIKAGGLVFIAVKQIAVPSVLRQIASLVDRERTTLVSLASGLTLQNLAECMSPSTKLRIIRVMCNTPASVRAGASCYCGNSMTTPSDLEFVQTLLSSVGLCQMVPEIQIDAMSALMGSSTSFMFIAVEAMADGGVKMGIPRDQAIKFAAQAMLGSAKMVLETGLHPGVLKDSVCSPGGSNIAGVHELENSNFRAALITAIQASTLRARELGKKDR